MLIENEFEVAAPIDRVWNYLLDVERVVPCMPGASLTETVDERNWKGKVTIKLGPVTLNFAGKVEMAERDEGARRVMLKASGMEQRGKGAASATVTSSLEEAEGGTRVSVVQDIKVSGQAAQFSRGMMQDVSSKLTKQFAECLQKNIAAGEPAATEPAAQVGAGARPGEAERAAATPAPDLSTGAPPQPVAQAKPISGLRLALGALWGAIVRFFKRLFQRG